MRGFLPRFLLRGNSVARSESLSLFSCLSFILLLIVCVGTAQIFAQADISNSTLKGRVVDQAGAAVRGATVAVVSAERAAVRTTKSDDDGAYRVPLLQPGLYEVRIEAPGFQRQVLNQLVLTVGQIAVRDIQLQVGVVKAELSVSDSTVLVDTERTQQSDTVERRQIVTLPNLSRNFTYYISTLPGVADVSGARVQQTVLPPCRPQGFPSVREMGEATMSRSTGVRTIPGLAV
jgi:hypothetical protein